MLRVDKNCCKCNSRLEVKEGPSDVCLYVCLCVCVCADATKAERARDVCA